MGSITLIYYIFSIFLGRSCSFGAVDCRSGCYLIIKNIFGKDFGEESIANFRSVYILLFENKISPFPKTLASHNSMQKKDDKVGNKTTNKEGEKQKKSERERKIEIDSRMREKKKSCLITSD